MMGVGMLLRSLGVKVTDEHVTMIETLIPQIPTRLNQMVSMVNGALVLYDARLEAIERTQAEILQRMKRDTGTDCNCATCTTTKRLAN